MYSLIQKGRRLNVPTDSMVKLFDSCVEPILLYGCEVCGYENVDILEKVHTQSEYMVDSVITHANKTASTVYWMFVVIFFIVHSYVCIPSSGYNNDYTATALRTATLTRYTVGVYNSSIWMHLVSSKCVLG